MAEYRLESALIASDLFPMAPHTHPLDEEPDFLAGRLLVAMPGIGDPRFERAVIYMCAHDDEHAMGLTLNRPVEGLTLPDLLARLEIEPTIDLPPDLVLMAGRWRRGAASCCTRTTTSLPGAPWR